MWRTIIFTLFSCISSYAIANEILPSPLEIDESLSKTMTLNNGMKVIIISNPSASVSAASITIGAGRRHTPSEVVGLPHLLEHAVFMGSKQYPQTNAWDKYFRGNGGWSNGSTRTDNTRYHFQIEKIHFAEALLRLEDMIFNPILSDESITIALNEVDEEFQSKKGDDWQGILSVIQANTSSKNGASLITPGNLESLGSDIARLKSQAAQFHKTYYTPDNMALAIYADMPFKEASELVKSIFDVPYNVVAPNSHSTPLHQEHQLGKLISIEGLSGAHTLDVRFEVPVNHIASNRNTAKFVAHLLGHESPGSIYYSLKKKGLVNTLSTVFQGDNANEVLDIYIDLTTEGVKSYEQVLATIFQYINMLKTVEIPDYLQTELQWQASQELNRSISKEPGDWLSDISDIALYVGAEDALTYSYEYESISKQQLLSYLNFLSAENAQVYLSTKLLDNSTFNTPYYDRGYAVSNLSLKRLNALLGANLKTLHLPFKNKYIEQGSSSHASLNFSAQVIVNERFSQPDVLLTHLQFPKSNSQELNTTMALMLSDRLRNGLGDDDYFSLLAGYSKQIVKYPKQMAIAFEGPASRLQLYATDVLNRVFEPISPKEFSHLKINAIESIKRGQRKQDFRLVSDLMRASLQGEPSVEQIRQAMDKVSLSEFNKFMLDVKGKLLVFTSQKRLGNLSALSNGKHSIASSQQSQSHAKTDDGGTPKVSVFKHNKAISFTVSAATGDLKAEAILHVLRASTANEFYHLMRRQKQLAYVADTLINELSKPSLSFVVESSKVTTDQLVIETSCFLKNTQKRIFAKANAKDFGRLKSVAIKAFEANDRGVLSDSYQFSLGSSNFERDHQLVEEIKQLSSLQITSFVDKLNLTCELNG